MRDARKPEPPDIHYKKSPAQRQADLIGSHGPDERGRYLN